MNIREARRSTIVSGTGVAVLVMAVTATTGCLTPGETREVQTQLQEIRRQVDQLRTQQEHSRQAVDATLARAESATPGGSAAAGNDAIVDATPIRGTPDAMPASRPPGAAKPDEAAMAAGGQPAASSLQEAEHLYREGYAFYHRGDDVGAERALRSFLLLDPGGPRADNAQYWIGETYYSRGLFREAILEFTSVVTDYPRGNKAAHALYKVALCHEHLGEGPLARENLEALVRTYPGSDVAPLARERLKKR